MASVKNNIIIRGPLLSDSVTRFASFSENLDGSLPNSETGSPFQNSLIPFESNPNEELLISSMEALGCQSWVPSVTNSFRSSPTPALLPPKEPIDDSSQSSPAKSVNNPHDNSSSLIVPGIAEENLVEASSSTMFSPDSPDSHFEEMCPSISLKEASSLVGAGLANLGNTCFINSVLQCLTHATLLVQGLRSANHLKICECDNSDFCLLCIVHDHIELSLSSSGGIVSPYKLVDNLNYISSYFLRYQQEDAHEFLQCLLDKLGSDCLYLTKNNGNFASESDNLVKRIFGGHLMSKVCCCNCGHLSNTYEPLMDLSLEIENVDCLLGALESFTGVEKINDPEMKFNCENCKEDVSIEKHLILDKVPSVAVFHLKRFKTTGNFVEKIEKHVKFPLELDLKPYTSSAQDADVEVSYELYAIVEHVGTTSTSGHYISFVRPSPDSWYRFDDSKVSLVPENYVLSQEAYILFYVRQGTPWLSSLMESQKQRFDNNASIPLPISVLDHTNIISDTCHSETKIDESTEFGYFIPSQIPSHHLSTQAPESVEEPNNNPSDDVSKSSHIDEDEHKKVDGIRDMACFDILTPPRSPEPNAIIFESQGYCIPRAQLKAEKQVKKVVESSEKREALRYVQRSRPNSRGMKLITAMLDSPSYGLTSKTKKRTRTSPCKKSNSPNTRRKLSHGSVARFVAARN